MKQTALLLAIAICLSTSGFAQSHHIAGTPASFQIGIKAGANLSKLNGDNWDAGFKANFLGGIYGAVNALNVGGQIEALFVQSTYVTDSKVSHLPSQFFNQAADSAKNGSFRVSYLSIPVLLNLRFIPKVTVQLGPQYSGVVSVKDKDGLLKDAKSLFKSGQLSGVIGLWVNLPGHLNVGARYVIGFTNIQDESGFKKLNAAVNSWKERNVQLHVGYSF